MQNQLWWILQVTIERCWWGKNLCGHRLAHQKVLLERSPLHSARARILGRMVKSAKTSQHSAPWSYMLLGHKSMSSCGKHHHGKTIALLIRTLGFWERRTATGGPSAAVAPDCRINSMWRLRECEVLWPGRERHLPRFQTPHNMKPNLKIKIHLGEKTDHSW